LNKNYQTATPTRDNDDSDSTRQWAQYYKNLGAYQVQWNGLISNGGRAMEMITGGIENNHGYNIETLTSGDLSLLFAPTIP
jgi:hypothetical protein